MVERQARDIIIVPAVDLCLFFSSQQPETRRAQVRVTGTRGMYIKGPSEVDGGRDKYGKRSEKGKEGK